MAATAKSMGNMGEEGSEGVKEIINTIFSSSKKLEQFLEQMAIGREQAYNLLINNELFTLSITSVAHNKNQEDVIKSVERRCIHKLERMLQLENQKKICERLENKV